MKKSILVTGGNAGIGFALCRQLCVDHGCKVYMGSRNRERGEKALKEIKNVSSIRISRVTFSINQSIDESIDESMNRSMNEAKNQAINVSMNESKSQPT